MRANAAEPARSKNCALDPKAQSDPVTSLRMNAPSPLGGLSEWGEWQTHTLPGRCGGGLPIESPPPNDDDALALQILQRDALREWEPHTARDPLHWIKRAQ